MEYGFLQLGNTGQAQFGLHATALDKIYREDAKIHNKEEAIQFIKRTNAAIQERLDYFWRYVGYSYDDPIESRNHITNMRVLTTFTSTV